MPSEAEEFKERLIEAIQEWAKFHPSPTTHRYRDGLRLLSARQLADEVANQTDFGKRYINRLERIASSGFGPEPEELIDSIREVTELFFKPRIQV